MGQNTQPDYNKLKGTITINIYENCSTWQVAEGIAYHEIIGVLENTYNAQQKEVLYGLAFRYKKYYKYKFVLRYNSKANMYDLIEITTGYRFVQETSVKCLIDQMLKRFSIYSIKDIDRIIQATLDKVGTTNTMDTIKVM